MNMNQRQLRMFTVLAKEGHFSRASELLHISQPALTRAIQELESQLGVPLFIRTTRQLSLSEDGKRFLPMAQRLLSDIEQMTQELRSQATGIRGTVTVALGTAFGTVLMPAVLKKLQRTYPDVQVRLLDDNSAGITARVLRAEADIGVGSPVGDAAALSCVRVASAPIGLLAHLDYFELTERLDARQIANLPLLREPEDTSIMNMLRARGSELVGQMQRGIEVSSLAMQLALVREGVGVAVLSALGASHALAQGMRFVPLNPPIAREVFIMTQRRRVLSSPALALIGVLRETLQAMRELPGALHPLVQLHMLDE
jgi:LysR family transcriptional regulator, carnitine catabolism transcriptional activator